MGLTKKKSNPQEKEQSKKKPKPKKESAKVPSKVPGLKRLPTETVRTGLKKTGFPLELRIRKILRDSGWSTSVNYPYLDNFEDTPTERTVDVIADRKYEPKSDIIKQFQLNLVIECKQQENSAWIFDKGIKRKIDWSDRYDAAIYCGDSILISERKLWADSAYSALGQTSHQCPESFRYLSYSGNTYIQSGEGKMEMHPDLLYKGSNQVMGALLHYNNTLGERSKGSPSFFWRNYPVLVFNGSLFYAFLNNDGEMDIQETEYVQYYYQTTKRWYLIDVVRFDFLAKYLESVNIEFEKSSKLMDAVEKVEKKSM